MRAESRQHLNDDREQQHREDGKQDVFHHLGVGVADLIEGNFIPGIGRELRDGMLNQRAIHQQRACGGGQAGPYPQLDGAQELIFSPT